MNFYLFLFKFMWKYCYSMQESDIYCLWRKMEKSIFHFSIFVWYSNILSGISKESNILTIIDSFIFLWFPFIYFFFSSVLDTFILLYKINRKLFTNSLFLQCLVQDLCAHCLPGWLITTVGHLLIVLFNYTSTVEKRASNLRISKT